MKKLFILLFMMLLSMMASAYDFKVDGIYYSITSMEEKTVGVTYDNNAYLKSYNGDIVIPSKVEYKGIEFTVTSILDVAFGSWNGGVVTSVQLPETIKLIDSQAFWACKYLTEINLPNSLEVINYGAFADCTSLKRIVIPNSVMEINDLQTNRGIFQGCTSLESVVLSENIKKIPYRAFYNCYNLIEIEIPEYVESIGDEAFCNCKIIKEIVIPEHVNYIGYNAFESCEDMESIRCLSSIPPEMYESFTNSHYMFTNLIVPPGTKKIYKSDTNWGRFVNIEEEIGEIYNLVYYIDEEVYKTYEIRHGTAIISEPTPTKEGYTFSGWSEIPETMPACDVTVTGTFSVNKYKLTYVVDGEEYKSYEVEYGANITPEAEPTKEGYIFSDWSDIPTTMPAEDVTVTGSFIVNKYTLTYQIDGESYNSFEVEYGATIIAEDEPTKEGYTFSGWSVIPTTMPANDVTVTGKFSINSYKLAYMIDDKVYKETMYEYEAAITPEPQPEGDYATFEWADLPQTMPAHDVVVYASYTSGILDLLMSKQQNISIYSPNGKRLNELQKGVNIIHMSDGRIKKIVINK